MTVLVFNPGGRKSGTDTEFSVSELVDTQTKELLELAEADGNFGKRKQETLKALVGDTLMWNPYYYPHRSTEQSFRRDAQIVC